MSLITSPNLFSNPFRIMATITVFLNDVPQEKGGEFIFTKPEDGNGEAVYITPTKGLAIVHHNTDEKYNFDRATIHKEAVLTGGYKYIAKKYVYLNPQPNHIRIGLPLMAMSFGGKLPRIFITLHNTLIDKFGPESGETYYRKIITMIPVLLLIGIAQLVANFVSDQLKKSGDSGKKEKETKAKPKRSKATKSKKL